MLKRRQGYQRGWRRLLSAMKQQESLRPIAGGDTSEEEKWMAKITVYRTQKFDISTDEFRYSLRYWTREGAKIADLTIDEGSAVEIDEEDLTPEGLCTDRGYNPDRLRGFQTCVIP
ncbi:hypothetical protein [Rhizobium sp. IY2]